MSYRHMSNREGNQQRMMEMREADMPDGVIAAYMTHWGVPMDERDAQAIMRTHDSMGARAIKKSDVEQAIKTHQRLGALQVEPQPSDENDDTINVVLVDDDEDSDS